MTIRHLALNDLIRVAAAGGGFRLDCRSHPVNDLIRIAAAASGHNSTIHLEASNALVTNDMIRIAAAGKGSVYFE